MSNFPRQAFATSDGVQLSYIRQGSGRPIVLLHGWSQCAEEFKHQIEPLSARYEVIALDQRSHGESQKVPYGLKISRLSKDLYDLLAELDLNEVALLGHSMGSCVILCYLDLFGPERLSKIILVDQPPLVTSDPHWTPQELEEAGATLTAQQVFDTVAALRGKEAEQGGFCITPRKGSIQDYAARVESVSIWTSASSRTISSTSTGAGCWRNS